MKTITPTVRLRLWLETEDGMLLGVGRAALLAHIETCGSLNRAAKAMGMSYRAAWGRLKATEEQLGTPVVAKAAGRKGFELTEEGRRLASAFRAWHAEVEAYALECGGKYFPWTILPYQDKGNDDSHG
ncbi:hypothetical protein JCM15519_13500 [Fundidesulfovibrio butyratiphilus]